MKLLHFESLGQPCLGLKTPKGIINLSKQHSLTLEQLMANHVDLQSISDSVTDYLDEENIKFLPAVLQPGKILCVGLNYAKHIEESLLNRPVEPLIFAKVDNALYHHQGIIPINPIAKQLDYEGELVVVIGKMGKNIAITEAMDYVFGFTVGNDVADRGLQFSASQWLIGKSLDHSAPIGPYLVTKDELNLNEATIVTRRNGVVVQNAKASEMLFDIPTIISYISRTMTLNPGDLIFTGTPNGSIMGRSKDKQVWLTKGDVVSVTIEPIGTLINYFE